MGNSQRILLLMSGSIACAKATQLISTWRKQGHEVRVATTSSVGQFVGRATLEGLSGERVFSDTFAAGQAMDHIEWAQWADAVVACPASANLLGKLANGIADDAVTTLWLATWGRQLEHFVVPAMNSHMWRYPATRANVETLRSWGVHVLPTADGLLACGETGEGRMLEPEAIVQTIAETLESARHDSTVKVLRAKTILVTGGGTREPIDAVRYIGNTSSGRTAASLVDALASMGHQVDWLGSQHAVMPAQANRTCLYETFADLQGQLREQLGRQSYDTVIHAAAVSDFSIDPESQLSGAQSKIRSDQPLSLQLKPNPKLLSMLRDYSCNPNIQVIGFKLTVGASEEDALNAVKRQFKHGNCDRVVHNDWQDITAGHHCFRIYRPDGSYNAVENAFDLAAGLNCDLGTLTLDSVS